MTDQPHMRISWVPQVADPKAPTAEELAAGVPLGDVVDDGLQFTRDDSVDSTAPLLPDTRRYTVIHNADGSVDVIHQALRRVVFRDWDGTIREGWGVIGTIDPASLERLKEAATACFGRPLGLALVDMSDLDALT